MIKRLNFTPVKHEEVAICVANQRIPNVFRIAGAACCEAIRGISSGYLWVSVTGTRRYQVGVSHHIREANMIEVSNLTKKYGDHIAVDHLSFRVEKGQIYGFLGPNVPRYILKA